MSGCTGGDRLQTVLAGMAARLQADQLRMGFLAGSNYPDGTPTPLVAATLEFGGRIQMPARSQTIYRSIQADGTFNRNGKFVRRSKSNYATQHPVSAHVITIPPRPYFRNMIKACSPKWGADLAKYLRAQHMDGAKALDQMGMHMSGQLRLSIRNFVSPGLAASTIRRKGFDKPLIESSHLINSVSYEVGQ